MKTRKMINGPFKYSYHEHLYSLDMQYSPTGRILKKTQTYDRMSYDDPSEWVPQHKTTYDWDYKYEGSQQEYSLWRLHKSCKALKALEALKALNALLNFRDLHELNVA